MVSLALMIVVALAFIMIVGVVRLAVAVVVVALLRVARHLGCRIQETDEALQKKSRLSAAVIEARKESCEKCGCSLQRRVQKARHTPNLKPGR
jgi:predicted Holliday junction resolvase-like endonuclease